MSNRKYLFNTELPFIKENFAGNLFENGEFKTEFTVEEASLGKVLKWKLGKNPQQAQKTAERYQLPIINNPDSLQTDADKIVWLGHAAFLVQLNGIRMLFDPCLENLPAIKRKVPAPYTIAEMGKIDYVILSHAHRDHLDKKSIGKVVKFNPEVQFLVPLKTSNILKSTGAKNIIEMGWYQRFETTEFMLDFLPAQHWNRRWLNDFNKTLWGSFSLKTKLQHIFYAGDTGFNKLLFNELKTFAGKADFAMLPIGAYMPAFMMKESHINPEEAAEMANILQVKTVLPMHYGTYDLSDEPMSEPIKRLRIAKETNVLKASLKELAVGETLIL